MNAFLQPTIIISMKQKSIEYWRDTLLNWSKIDVRVVPGVMYQVLCREDSTNKNIEHRFHWFLDCTETYVYNHRYNFDTYCPEGEYMEKLWNIIEDASGKITYRISRTSGNKLGIIVAIPGVLLIVNFRHHFSGNILHVATNQFHSIYPISRSNNHVVTFVVRQSSSSAEKNTYILSRSESIEGPIDETRPATPEERQLVHHKLQQILQQMISDDKGGDQKSSIFPHSGNIIKRKYLSSI
jgi:hypothetical protein